MAGEGVKLEGPSSEQHDEDLSQPSITGEATTPERPDLGSEALRTLIGDFATLYTPVRMLASAEQSSPLLEASEDVDEGSSSSGEVSKTEEEDSEEEGSPLPEDSAKEAALRQRLASIIRFPTPAGNEQQSSEGRLASRPASATEVPRWEVKAWLLILLSPRLFSIDRSPSQHNTKMIMALPILVLQHSQISALLV